MIKMKENKKFFQNYNCLKCKNIRFPLIWNELRKTQELCDGCLLISNGNQIKIHRAILSASSDYFKCSFVYNNSRNLNNLPIMKIDVNDQIINLILDYAYTGACSIDWTNVEEIIKAADKYGVLGLVELGAKFLQNETTNNNCIGIYQFSKYYNCIELEKFTKKFILSDFKNIFQFSNQIEEMDMNYLIEILNDDNLNVRSENAVLSTVIKWIKYDITAREKYAQKLLNCVRFGLIDYNSLRHRFMTENIINKKNIYKSLSKVSNRTRTPHEIIFTIGGWINGSPTSSIETFDARANKWSKPIYIDKKRAYHAVCVVDNKIYVLGGFDGITHFNTLRCYDPLEYKWEEKACMYQVRCYLSCVVHEKKIYAIGGYNGRTRLNSVERYYPEKNQWEKIAPMQKQRSDAGAAATDKYIYVVGGFNGNEILNSCEMYDIKLDCWTLIPFMLSPRSGVRLINYNEMIYAIGGYNGQNRLNSVEFYDFFTRNWSFASEMTLCRSNFASVVLENFIYVIGGFDGKTTMNSVEYYDKKANKWKLSAQLNDSKSALDACVLKGLSNARTHYLSSGEPLKLECVKIDDVDSNERFENFTDSPLNQEVQT